MEQRLSVVTLGVADLEQSRRFYEHGLGFLRGNSSEEFVFFQLNGVILALFPRDHLAADVHVPSEGNGFLGMTLARCTRSWGIRMDSGTITSPSLRSYFNG